MPAVLACRGATKEATVAFIGNGSYERKQNQGSKDVYNYHVNRNAHNSPSVAARVPKSGSEIKKATVLIITALVVTVRGCRGAQPKRQPFLKR